jgi:hypothetical protein
MKKLISQRVVVRVPVTLQMTVAGQRVALQAVTVYVSAYGALIQCSRRIDCATKLEMQNDRTGQKQICKVTLTPTESQQSYLIPLEFASPTPGFWQISFPPTDWKPVND